MIQYLFFTFYDLPTNLIFSHILLLYLDPRNFVGDFVRILYTSLIKTFGLLVEVHIFHLCLCRLYKAVPDDPDVTRQ